MPTPELSQKIKHGTQLNKRILDRLQDRIKLSKTEYQQRHQKWKDSEEAFLAYMPERDVDAARRLNRDQSGNPEYTTISIPYSYALLMSSHTYWTTVFLARNPVMQFTGRHGESSQQVQALEAVIDYQNQVGGFLVPLYVWLFDTGKYGVGILGNYWENEEVHVSSIQEQPATAFGIPIPGKTERKRVVRKVPGYQGNKLYNVRPYDFLPDPRVPLWRFQEGEFCGVYVELGWNKIMARERQGVYINTDRLRTHKSPPKDDTGIGDGTANLFYPDVSQEFDRKDPGFKRLYEVYVDLVPKEWGLGTTEFPEKWVFTCTTDFSILIGAQPHGGLHNKFPFFVQETEPDGYSLAPRSGAEVIEPIQNTIDWLINSHFYNVRKALNDQIIIDPSRVEMADVLDPLPGGVWRLKPAAYGSKPGDAYEQVKITDVTQAHMGDLGSMLELGQRVSGVNDQIMGMINAGGRKTATEVRTSSSFGVNRLKTDAEYMAAMGWSPLASVLVQNTQQYLDMERKFKIVGDLALEAGQQFIDVTPETIAGFYDFVPVDGTLPIDRFAQAKLWQELFAQIVRIPVIGQQYDLGRVFGWVAQLAGLKNINQFKIQITPDQQIAQDAQSGNVVPIAPGSPPAAQQTPAPSGQVSQVGPTG